jgi:2-polyprenyl-3-methyl-5-hydroxy-6-metoxy-1,4-benzoquinol methylase
MISTERDKQWQADERGWWNSFGDYMTQQWKLTPFINWCVRRTMEADRDKYLLAPGGSLLDVGCGGGWLSAHFATLGMDVLGIDISEVQIAAATKLSASINCEKTKFICADMSEWDCAGYEGQFDSAFINAFLHHLPDGEMSAVLAKVARVLKPGGVAYLYEPLESSTTSRNVFVQIVDRVCNGLIVLFLGRLPSALGLYDTHHKEQLSRGYSMQSPRERPLNIEQLQRAVSPHFLLLEVKAWHLFSIGAGMQVMACRRWARSLLSFIVPLLYFADRIILRVQPWQNFSLPGRFILCSLKMKSN